MKNLYYLGAIVLFGACLLAARSTPTFRQAQGGLTLDQLIEIGLENSNDIRVAERNLQSARAGRRSSISGVVPRLSASLSRDMDPKKIRTPEGYEVDPEVYSSSLSLSQTIFDGARSWYSISSSNNAVASSEVALEQTWQQAVLAIKDAYYNYLSNQDLVEVAEEALALSRRHLEQVEERYRLQAVSETDLLKARVTVGQREADLIRNRQNLISAATSLNLALGIDPRRPVSVARDSVVIMPQPDKETASRLMAENNPTLRLQVLSLQKKRLNAKMQRGVLLPSVRISSGVSAIGSKLSDIYDFDYEQRGSARLSISIPLFTGFQNTSSYSQARYAALAEEEKLEELERQLQGQLENTLTGLETLHKILPVYQDVFTSAQADVHLADERYNLGAISILDLLDAQLSLVRAQKDIVRSKYDIKKAEAQLEALMGTIGQ